MATSLSFEHTRKVFAALHQANHGISSRYPGSSGARRPVHTVYGGAHLFRADLAARLGARALAVMDEYFADPQIFAETLGVHVDAALLYDRVRAKLKREPVEDYRIDFEDGYGYRSDAEEDEHAVYAARQLAEGRDQGLLPPFVGIRIKPLNEELHARSIRTLDLFLTTAAQCQGLPPGFVVTLPKVQAPEQVVALSELLAIIEEHLGMQPGSVKVELMVETPQALLDSEGRVTLPHLVEVAAGRCTAVHFGAYDYTAALGVTAAHQGLRHPTCDFARYLMQTSLAGTGVAVCDSATTVLPLPRHRPSAGGSLSTQQREENRRAVHAAARLHYDNIWHALQQGIYHSWDLHPAQLPVRFAALYAFFLEGRDAASSRLRHFMAEAAQATSIGEVFDDAATGQGLLNFFLQGLACGALTLEDVAATGLTVDDIRSQSFVKILDGRRKG
jgi:citrate lyase beta subunit